MLRQLHRTAGEFTRFSQMSIKRLRVGLQRQKRVLDALLPSSPRYVLLHLCRVALAKGEQITGLVQVDLVELLGECLFVNGLGVVQTIQTDIREHEVRVSDAIVGTQT